MNDTTFTGCLAAAFSATEAPQDYDGNDFDAKTQVVLGIASPATLHVHALSNELAETAQALIEAGRTVEDESDEENRILVELKAIAEQCKALNTLKWAMVHEDVNFHAMNDDAYRGVGILKDGRIIAHKMTEEDEMLKSLAQILDGDSVRVSVIGVG